MRDEHKIDAFKVGYDRALAGYWVEEMKSNGFTMEPVAQGPFTWSQPMREMGAAFADKIVNYNKNPVLVWCLSNTAVKKSGVNNIQPVKITDKRRIDGAVSLLNAWVIYVKYYDDFMYNVGSESRRLSTAIPSISSSIPTNRILYRFRAMPGR